jgi:hypothetical protein
VTPQRSLNPGQTWQIENGGGRLVRDELAVATSGGKGLFGRRLAPGIGVLPRLVTGEHPSAHCTFTQHHWIHREVSVGKDSDKNLANSVVRNPFAAISNVVFGHVE